MPWSSPVAVLVESGNSITVDISSDTLIEYNLFDQLGGPADPVIVVINISASADLGELIIDNRFNVLSIFTINLTGDGRTLGKGGDGGRGGHSETEPGVDINIAGAAGLAAGTAIKSAFDFNLDTDDGFVLGGGGGGGGGGVNDGNVNGSGGGGGQGYNISAGGPRGTGGGVGGNAGEDGSVAGLGAGGAGGASFGAGGDGGAWGTVGDTGANGPSEGIGGAGGTGGLAIAGSPSAITVTLTGAKNQTTLETESRLEGGYSQVTFV